MTPSRNIRSTSNHLRHEKPTASMCLYETLDEDFHHTTIVDWLKEAKCTSEAIRISSTSTTIPCSMRGNIVEALHDPAAEASIISEYLGDILVGKKPLTLIDRYFRSPSGHFFQCRGIVRGVPITIDKIDVRLDFHIYNVLDFDLLPGNPLEKLLDSSQGSLDEKLREPASAIATSCSENPMAKPLPEQNMLEKMMHVSLFGSFEPVLFEVAKSTTPEKYDSEEILHLCEDERSSSAWIKFVPFPLARSSLFSGTIEIQP
jgi:hypothetical protein